MSAAKDHKIPNRAPSLRANTSTNQPDHDRYCENCQNGEAIPGQQVGRRTEAQVHQPGMNGFEPGAKILIPDHAARAGAKWFELGRQHNPFALNDQEPVTNGHSGCPGRQEPHGHSGDGPLFSSREVSQFEALVHFPTEGEIAPDPGLLCDDRMVTDGIRASGRQHPIQYHHADGSLGLLSRKAAGP